MIAHPHYALPLRGDLAKDRRRRLDQHTLSIATQRLTRRDRWLLHMLAEHTVLTTNHITELAFSTQSATNRRMRLLHQLRAVERFRPFTPHGSAPWHYILGDTGATVLAAEAGITSTECGYRRSDALAIAHSPQLAHTVGANGFFTALAAYARGNSNARLRAWWSPQRCATAWGDIIRPDGYGRWQENNHHTDFFLEHDTGTEPLHRLAAKLVRYHQLAITTEITTPLLFWLASPRRELNLHRLLGTAAVLVATATPQTGSDPADSIWQIAGQPEKQRVPLSHIAIT